LIRFYADYTGIGLTELTERFVASYGHELPGIPRPDRVQWWNAQKDELADSSSALDLNLRTFGLDRTATNDDIEEAYRLAEKRHDPMNFESLGEKEQALAQRSFDKYRSSHEMLTEIEA